MPAPTAEPAVHDAIESAARGELPPWSVAGTRRREHMQRVMELMGDWAEALDLGEREAARWRAAGLLHDALRDEDGEALRVRVPVELRGLPDRILHGPAAAELLRVDGVLDGPLLRAIAYHTVGHGSFRRLGRALYAADFLEPGRELLHEWRASLRARMPEEADDVVYEIARARIGHLVEHGMSMSALTLGFWNRLVAERA